MPILINKTASGGSIGLTSTGVITEGLTVYYNPTFPASYPGSGTSLSDLSGNGFTSTLNNGTAFSSVNGIKSISFDGVDDYAIRSGTPTSLQGNSELTVCGWFKRRDTVSTKLPWVLGSSAATAGLAIGAYVTSGELITITTFGVAFSTGVTYPLNDWVFCAWQKRTGLFNRVNVTVWRNLVSYTDTQLTITAGSENAVTNIGTTGIALAADHSGNIPAPIDIATFMVYNRVLTSAEITRTYNATKTYVGL